MNRGHCCCYLGLKEVELHLQNRYRCCCYLGPKEVELDLQIGTIVIVT
jgi:hypothetical protein